MNDTQDQTRFVSIAVSVAVKLAKTIIQMLVGDDQVDCGDTISL